MTHILLNVEYSDLMPILKDEKIGEYNLLAFENVKSGQTV